MGAVGGSAYYFLKGLHNSPNGARIAGGMQAARMNAPRLGGSFAVWGTLFSTFHCTSAYVRRKEDPWNSIIVVGGFFLALIEGAGLMANCFAPQMLPSPPADDPNMAAAISMGGGGGFPGLPQPVVSPAEVVSSSSGGSWFDGLFGKKEEKKPSGSAGMSEILESFEAPSPPIPSFEYK
ncbi:unnamed protein product [Triticum turgidum subsp. durum]|uniref:Mitochondrial import inner membrane translocase subunit TIM17 n=1 Tax=Triticum turgidum subsp. durum TaxID=4567 RepID=A0A9R1RJQ8_TRITD|nr:unnamed protein product [Triticum turgidum subsp. durum]